MLKYTIFEPGIKQDENQIKCPNCHVDKNQLRGNIIDNVYVCKKCGCRFGINCDRVINNTNKPVKTYNLA